MFCTKIQQGKIVTSLTLAGMAAAMLSPMALAGDGLSANVGLTSNYLWRGVTQTDDQAAISGGIDYSGPSGFYLGTWASNVDFNDDTNAEVDLYGGFAGEAGDFGYDVGYIYYGYPGGKDLDFSEVYIKGSWQNLSLGISSLVDADRPGAGFGDDIYVEAGLSFEILTGVDLAFHVGNYDYDVGTDYTHYSVTLSKNGFSLMLSDASEDSVSEDLQVVISYAMDIEL